VSIRTILQQAERWDQQTDLNGWWMCEKLDGVHFWMARNSCRAWESCSIHPKWFTEGLAGELLDGER
jgi:hypothetical protein